MTTQSLKVIVPPQIQAPRGAAWAAVVVLGVSLAARSLWQGLVALGERRASNELNRLARQCESFDPERARVLREAARTSAHH
jgi:hypothetical protein